MKLSVFNVLVLSTAMMSAGPAFSAEFSFETLRQRAAEMAKQSYTPESSPKLPPELASLDYNQYQQLQFRPEASPWHSKQLRFDLRFISRGFIFHDGVKMHVLNAGRVQDIHFDESLFNFGSLRLSNSLPADLDFAGFKMLHHDEPGKPWDEVASFLGASYFRLTGKGLRYGGSARALALDTAEAAGEEFPRFTEIWIETPAPLADHLLVMALLDTPSAAGACRFVFNIGQQTSAEIEACIFPRAGSRKYGLAPLTSMFLMGKNRIRYVPDFRPEVHDSDGLLIITEAGERLWRPLENPAKRHRISRFPFRNLRSFGLMQRDRSFVDYQDLEARYDLRPGFLVEPIEAWGEGSLELVEIPTPGEFNDNIVAYWVPAQKPQPGHELRLRYRLTALGEEPPGSVLKVVATRISPAVDQRLAKYVIDFAGAVLDVTEPAAAIQPQYTVTGGKLKNVQAIYNEVTGGWRVVFDFQPGDGDKEVRLHLESGGKRVSETWVQRIQTE